LVKIVSEAKIIPQCWR